jgi:outer membrane protein TolC
VLEKAGHYFFLLASSLCCLDGHAQAVANLNYAQALEQISAVSGTIQGARLDVQAKALQADALRRVSKPDLNLSGFAGRVSTSFNFDTSRISQAANPIIGGIDVAMPSLALPTIPNAITATRIFDLRSFGLTSIWPLYTGGRLDAIHGVAGGRAQEAAAELKSTEDNTATELAQRYFSLQLAQQTSGVRRATVDALAEHQRMAMRLEKTGLMSKVERLKADMALDSAKREASKAQSDAEIAQVALNRLLAAPVPVRPTTPLFVHSQSVGALQSFIDAGMAQNAVWNKIASKREQAAQSVKLQGSEHSPTVMVVGNYNLNRSSEQSVQPNWFVGLNVNIPIVERVDRARMIQAARLEQARVEASAEQAARDIPTLIESQWRTVEDARVRFLSLQSAIELAKESLRLQTLAFKEGQVSSVEVTDANVNLARSEVERVQAAYEYVLALAKLLEQTGQPSRLIALSTTADNIIAFRSD